MNEEIVVRFGGDLSSLDRSMRSAVSMARDTGHRMAEGFKEFFGHLTGPLSIAGVIVAFEKVMQEVKQIKREAETLKVSPQFVQDLNNVGMAAGIGAESIESMMGKFTKGLKPGTDVEEAVYSFADRLASIEDPGERARAVIERFGKAGMAMLPILSQGSKGLKEMADQFARYSNDDIEAIEHFHLAQEKLQHNSLVGLGKMVYGLQVAGMYLKNFWEDAGKDLSGQSGNRFTIAARKTEEQLWDKLFEAGRKSETEKGATKAAGDEAREKKAAEALAAYNKHLDELILRTGTSAEKLAVLNKQLAAASAALAIAQGADNKPDYYKALADVKDITARIKEERERQLKDEKKFSEDVSHTRRQIAYENQRRDAQGLAPYTPTLEELAASGQWRRAGGMQRVNGGIGPQFYWQEGPFADTAREILNLQADAKTALTWGNTGRAKWDRNRIDMLKQSLTDAGVQTPDMTLESIDGRLKESNEHLTGLLQSATATGIKIADE